MLIIGLTGSIGMGKSTAAARLRALRRRRVRRRRRGAPALRGRRRAADRGGVSRARRATARSTAQKLAAALLAEPDRLQAARGHRASAGARGRARVPARRGERGARRSAVLEIPLLFETGGETRVDVTVVVSAPPEHAARARAGAARHDDGEARAALLARQMPDAEKRARADFVVDTGGRSPRPRRKSITSSPSSELRRHGLRAHWA